MARRVRKEDLKAENIEMEAKRTARRDFLRAVKSYWEDVEAVERVNKINGRNSRLSVEECQALMDRYIELKGIKAQYGKDEVNVWRNIHMFTNSDRIKEDTERWVEKAGADELYITDFFWEGKDIDNFMELCDKYGIKQIHIFDSSTALMRNLVYFIEKGCKVEGTTKLMRKSIWDDKPELDKDGIIVSMPKKGEN